MPSRIQAHSNDRGALVWLRTQVSIAADHLAQVNAKSAATFNMILIFTVVIAASLWHPDLRSQPVQTSAAPLAPAPTAVKLIDAAPRGPECREQTWPYFDRNCLNYGAPQAETAARAPEAQKNVVPVVQSAQPVVSRKVQPATQPAPAMQPQAAARQVDASDRSAPSSYDNPTADEEDFSLTEEQIRAQARAQSQQRRALRHRGISR